MNSLYKNVMNKKGSVGILSIENPNQDKGSKSRPSTETSSRQLSRGNSASSLNVTLCNAQQARRVRNPIDHYEQNMNFALASKSSSTLDLPSAQRVALRERAHSTIDLRKTVSAKGKMIAANENPEKTHVSDQEDLNSKEDHNEVDNGASDVLRDEISSALNDDLFDREFSFDNKWTDESGFETFKDHSSVTSSNHSPLTKGLSKASINPISRRDSAILQDFERDLKVLASSNSKARTSDSGKNNSRLQLKLDTLKLRSENARGSKDSISMLSESSRSQNGSAFLLRYWATNVDVKTKLVSEGITRELNSVKRCTFDEKNAGGKVVVSMITRISTEKRLDSRRLLTPLTDNNHSTLPAIGNINSTQNDVILSDFFGSTLKNRNNDTTFEEKVFKTISDEDLRDYILLGRDHGNKMWLRFEKLEFD